MSAYLLAHVVPHDPDEYRASGYPEAAVETAARYGGRYLARGGAIEVLEGDWEPERMVIIEFPSMEQLQAWYASEEYAPWIDVRRRLTSSRLVAVEGIEAG